MNEITYALNSENKLVYINDVPNGENCNCSCPKCHAKLVAKNNGKIRVHHFAHASNSECVGAYQTMIHLLAKEIIATYRIVPFAQNGTIKLIRVAEIHLEKRFEDVIPDVIGILPITLNNTNQIIGAIPIFVEIYVTHKVDDEKAQKIKKLGIPTVEINLSNSQALSKEELPKDMSNPKNWKIINDKLNSKYLPKIRYNTAELLAAYRALMAGSSSYGRQSNNYNRHYRYRRRSSSSSKRR